MKTLTKVALAVVMVAAWGCTEPAPPPIQQEAPAAATVKHFSASPLEVAAGEKTRLSWEVENATAISIEQLGLGAVPGISSAQRTGEVEVTVQDDAIFLLTAHGEGGIDQRAAAVTTTGGASAVLLTSFPARIESGEKATLVWSAPGATSLALEDAEGVSLNMGTSATTGTLQVQPERTTRYVLHAGNRTVTAEVVVAGAIHEFSFNDEVPGEVSLSWRTGAVDSLSISAEGRGTIYTAPDAQAVKAATFTESIPDTLPQNSVLSYTLRAEIGTKVLTRNLLVYVGADPQIKVFTVPQYAKRGDGYGLDVAWSVRSADVVDVYFDDVHVFQTTLPTEIQQGSITGYQPPAGRQSVVVRLEASNAKGGAIKDEKEVDLVGVPQLDPATGFTAAPTPVNGTEPLELKWNIKDARDLTIRNKAGQIVATKTGLAAETGTVVVHINKDEEYTLEANNTLGDSVSATVVAPVNEIYFTSPGNGVVVQGGAVELQLPSDTHIYRLSFDKFTREAPSTGFIDISATGTSIPVVATGTLPATDDGLGKFTTNFSTVLFGETLSAATGVTVSTNGWLTFGDAEGDSRYYAYSLPRAGLPAYFIAPFWEDLQRRPAGGIHYQVVGSSPDQKLIVQWSKHFNEYYGYYGDAYILDVDFQVQISEEGDVSFHYANFAGSTSYAYPGTGIQGKDVSEYVASTRSVSATSGNHSDVEYWMGKKRIPLPATVVATSEAPLEYAVKRGTDYPVVSYRVPTFLKPNDLFISEIMYAPAAPYEAVGEYVEVQNRTLQPLDLDGFILTLGTGNTVTVSSANGPTSILPNEVLVFGQRAETDVNGGATVHYAYGTAAMDNDSASVSLSKNGGVASHVAYNKILGHGAPGVSITHDYGRYVTSGSGSAMNSRMCNTPATKSYGPGGLGTPGAWSACGNYRVQSIVKPFTDISVTGTALFASSASDDSVVTHPLGVAYPYFGVTPAAMSSVRVGINGYLTFDMNGTISATYSATARPATSAPNSVVSPFGDDLALNSGDPLSNVFAQRFEAGIVPTEAEGHWVFQWNALDHSSTSYDNSLTFQAKLFDSGKIEFHYLDMIQTRGTLDYNRGYSASTWLENSTGTEAIGLRTTGDSNDNPLSPFTAYEFVPVVP